MDTSKEYIKMCDCPEIQNLPDRENWDAHSYWFFKEGEKNEYGNSDEAVVAVIGDAEDCGYCLAYYCDRLPDATWLPTQSQLQEMLDGYFIDKLDAIFIAVRDYYLTQRHPKEREFPFTSMEQLWLAFYMKTKYNKSWDGNSWK